MNIHSITIQNFTSFRDRQKIEFSIGDKPVTLIEGEMGHGKLNLLNAFYWCFYSIYWHSDQAKFIQAPNPIEYHLINKGALDEHMSDGEKVEVKVEITFETDGKSIITVSRSLYAYHINGNWNSDKSTVFQVGIMKSDTGQYSLHDGEEADGILQRYFPSALSNYFLFRGENRDELVKLTGKSLFMEAIQKLSKLKLFERLVDHLVYSEKKARTEAGKELGGDIQREIDKLQLKIDQSDKMIKVFEEHLDELKEENRDNENEYIKYRDKIKENQEAYAHQHKIELCELQISQLDHRFKEILIERNKKIVSRWPSLLIVPSFQHVLQKYKEAQKAGTHPPDIKRSLLEKLIEEKICICGTDLAEGSPAFERITTLYSEGNNDELVREIFALATMVEGILPSLDLFINEIYDYDQKNQEIKQKISSLNDQIKGIKPKIGDISEDLRELQKKQDNAKERQINTKKQISDLIRRINEIKEKRKEYDREINAKTASLGKSELPRIRADIASESLSVAIALREEYEKYIFQEIESHMQEHWELICYDLLSYEKVKLDKENKYFDVCDSSGDSRRLSMNTGHRLLLTISFISSLMRIAKEIWNESIPIVMDAPLSEVGKSAMPKSVTGLTELFNQSILILQDGSVSDEIFSQIKPLVGARYSIIFDKHHQHSQIVEVN